MARPDLCSNCNNKTETIEDNGQERLVCQRCMDDEEWLNSPLTNEDIEAVEKAVNSNNLINWDDIDGNS